MILDDFEKMVENFDLKTQVKEFNTVLKSIGTPVCIEMQGESDFVGVSLCSDCDSDLKELIYPSNQNYLLTARAFQNFLNGVPMKLQKKYDYEMANPNGVDMTDLMWISEVYAKEIKQLELLIKDEYFLQKYKELKANKEKE